MIYIYKLGIGALGGQSRRPWDRVNHGRPWGKSRHPYDNAGAEDPSGNVAQGIFIRHQNIIQVASNGLLCTEGRSCVTVNANVP